MASKKIKYVRQLALFKTQLDFLSLNMLFKTSSFSCGHVNNLGKERILFLEIKRWRLKFWVTMGC